MDLSHLSNMKVILTLLNTDLCWTLCSFFLLILLSFMKSNGGVPLLSILHKSLQQSRNLRQ